MTDERPMWLRLRQIALVAEKLAPVEEELTDVLGIEVCFRDPGVGHFGLENALFPVGNQLLEVVAPVRENTAGGRYLERRKGDGGYMVITQCNDHAPRRARFEALGVRIVNPPHQRAPLQMSRSPRFLRRVQKGSYRRKCNVRPRRLTGRLSGSCRVG